jgi:hypothetical protein
MLELLPGQAFNASMEHSNEKQHSDDTPAYEACIQDIYLANQNTTDVLDKIKQFRDKAISPASEERTMLAEIMNGTLVVSRDAIHDDDVPAAGKMFLSGAMAGLYIGDEIMGGYVPTKRVLAASYELLRDDPRQFMHDAATTVEQMDPTTTHIVNKWKQAISSDSAGDAFFDIGFGIMMCSVNRTIYEIDTIYNLENSVDWELPEPEKPSPIALQVVDDDCLSIASAFQDHLTTLDVDGLTGEELGVGLQRVAELLEGHLTTLEDLTIDDCVQTRGFGIYIGLDEEGRPESANEFDDDLRIRGTVARVICTLVPTEYALIMGITEGDDIYEPLACLVLENVEGVEPSGNIVPRDGACAIPLRSSGAYLDKLLFKAE